MNCLEIISICSVVISLCLGIISILVALIPPLVNFISELTIKKKAKEDYEEFLKGSIVKGFRSGWGTIEDRIWRIKNLDKLKEFEYLDTDIRMDILKLQEDVKDKKLIASDGTADLLINTTITHIIDRINKNYQKKIKEEIKINKKEIRKKRK